MLRKAISRAAASIRPLGAFTRKIPAGRRWALSIVGLSATGMTVGTVFASHKEVAYHDPKDNKMHVGLSKPHKHKCSHRKAPNLYPPLPEGAKHQHPQNLPVIEHPAVFAPNVPPPCNRQYPAIVNMYMDTYIKRMAIDDQWDYEWWTFNGHVPGPIIRVRQGDYLMLTFENKDQSGMWHNIDFHSVTGPGGGASVLTCEGGQKKTARFHMLHPGVFIYHCAMAPAPTHVANGMYGLMIVEPKDGLKPVDREYYVLQSEVYATEPAEGNLLVEDEDSGLQEKPKFVMFNGSARPLSEKEPVEPLQAKVGERVRIFFGNAGPNLISSFHIIGTVFDKVFREGDLRSPPARSLQTTLVPAGGAAMVEMQMEVPGNYTLVDHALYRTDKGAVAFLHVEGDPLSRPDVFASLTENELKNCPNCKLHP